MTTALTVLLVILGLLNLLLGTPAVFAVCLAVATLLATTADDATDDELAALLAD